MGRAPIGEAARLTSPGGEWATARVNVRLNWDGIDTQLKTRLTASVEQATKAAQRHFDRLEVHGKATAKSIADAYALQMERMEAKTRTTVTKINQTLNKLDRTITVRLVVATNQYQLLLNQIRFIHERLQAWLQSRPLRVFMELNENGIATRLAQLTRDRTVNVDANVRNVRQLGTLEKGVRSLIGGLVSLGGSFLGMLGTFAKFGSIAGVAVVAVGALVPVVAALGPALAAVGIAAGGAAIAGLSALAIAVGALKVGMSGVGDAFSALGAEASSGGGAAVDVAKQMEDAQRALSRAVRDERDAQKGVADARKTALERLEDYNLEARGAVLSEKDAVLSLKEARNELATGKFDNGLERERAALRVEEAEQRLMEVREGNGDLESEIADARKKGVNGADDVVDANRRLVDATQAVADAQRAIGEVGKEAAGGVDKAAEALAKLSPNARAFVMAVQAIKPAWDAMKSTVQDSLFAGLADRITPLADTYLPLLGGALTRVADGFNEGAISAMQFAQSGTGISVMSTLLDTSSNMAGNLGSALGNLVPGLAAIAAGAGQAFSPLTDGMAGAVRGWSERMVELQQNGGMAAFFEKAMDIAAQLGAVLADVGGIISGVFNAAQAGGGNIMGTLGQVLDQVNAFVNSVEGQTALTSFFSAMTQAVGALLPIFMQLAGIIGTQVAPIIAQLITSIAPMIGPVLDALSQGITALQPAIGPIVGLFASIAQAVMPLLPIIGELVATFVKLAGPVLGMLAEALSPILAAVGEALISAFTALQPAIEPVGTLLEALSPIFTQIATIAGEVLSGLITALVPVITTLATGFGELLTALTPILPILGDALIQIITALAPMIQQMATVWLSVVQAIMPLIPQLVQVVSNLLPPLLQLITALLPIILMSAQLFAGLVVAIMPVITILTGLIAKFSEVVGAVIGFVADIVGKIVGFVSSVVGKFGELAQGISNKMEEAKTWVTDKFTALIEWVKGVPQKVTEAAKGMWDGIFGAFKGMVNSLIGLWNSLSDKLSFTVPDIIGMPSRGKKISPIPKIPKLAKGGSIFGEGGPTDDKILAWLSDKEFVVRAKAAMQPGARAFLDAFNTGRISMRDLGAGLGLGRAGNRGLPGFAAGGSVREPYGLPAGSSGGGDLFPQWVRDLEQEFGVTASTYAGHQEKDGQNKGIDWSGSVANMQRFAEFLASRAGDLEQVIWMNPETGQQIGVADGQMVGPGTSQPGYYSADWSGHTDHVHTRQSYSIGTAPAQDSPVEEPTGGSSGMQLAGGGGGSTPIGSGIGSSAGGSASWGNSGGGSKFNSAADALAANVQPVWVENWPSAMGGSGDPTIAATDTGTGLTPDAGAPAGPLPVPALTNESTPEEVAAAIYAEGKNRGYTDEEIKAFISTGLQESGLQMVEGGGGAWHGYFQQDESYPNRDDPQGNINGFLDRMDEKRAADPNSDIWKRIFWLQQAPSAPNAEASYQGGRQGYLDEIQSKQSKADELFAKAAEQGAMPVTIVDPTLPPPDVPDLPANSDPNAAPQLEYTPTTTTPSASMPNPSASTSLTPSTPDISSMPFGRARADAWASQQDWNGQAQQWFGDMTKEIGGQFLDPFGLADVFDTGIDRLLEYLKTTPPGEVKFADAVTFVGMDPEKSKASVTEGMTDVTSTYRGGG